ncbi:MAG TPA: type I DNA topoisomerase [Anaerolineaceae bacterium]|nr:type I DNA topoisomerase [Anaerolineaceae bacterium]
MILEAYCVKCRTKQEIKNPVASYNKIGAPVTKGVCSVCGTTLYRTGRTEEHKNLPPPIVVKKEPKRSGKLVIVESPAKAKTVQRFLGKEYIVKASVGHVRDLLRSELSVDVDNHFLPKYRVPNEKRQVVKELKQLTKTAEKIYLATDPDREGEAIAWHLMEATEIDNERTNRVVFHEITKPAIEEAFSHPRMVNMDLVNAQQARRILDRLVGYNLSPLLWQKVRSRLSAGRVQSVALRLIVEREREIEDFIQEEYWTIEAELCPEKAKKTYVAKLFRINGIEPDLSTKETAHSYLEDLEAAKYWISKVKRGERKRKAPAPFITSTLQQEASRRLGFTARRTMALAQQLYEGLEVGEGGSTGLITYMRTDSTNVSEVAQKETREYILKKFGKEYLPKSIPQHKTRVAKAQEAHEAIRPTSVLRSPEAIKKFVKGDQFKLYQLIWKRFIASQMESALYDTISVEVQAKGKINQYEFRASGSILRFAGFLIIYEEAKDEDKLNGNDTGILFPENIADGQPQNLVRLIPEQHFTAPPPRFTEASLVQLLEEYGIGRPSTYAPILSTIQERGYVEREKKRLFPTETGKIVNDLLVDHFTEVVDPGFTALMETSLDQVASGEKNWKSVIEEFYKDFSIHLERARQEMPETKTELEKIGRECPKCGHELVIRFGRFGKFISCSNFPTCRYTEPILEKIGVKCPDCSSGEVVIRRTRKGRIFYGCSNYPECQFTSWKQPVSEVCPTCSGTLVILNKRDLQCIKCNETFLQSAVMKNEKEELA